MSSRPIRCVVVEDNSNLNRDLVYYLATQGMEAAGVTDGAGLNRHLAASACDVIVLDLGLPGEEDGLDIARRIASRSELGLVILTARGQLEDRLAGWDSGAHAYLVKPAPLAEVAAVVGAVFRRLHRQPSVRARPWRLNIARRELLTPDGVAIPLTHRERLLLQAMAESPQRCVPRDLGTGQEVGGSIDTLVHRLRRKLKAHGDPIRTVYGEGLVFCAELLYPPPE